ncbi:ALIX V-shaped domain binding to HIV-domain-containing protein [Gautieria morchelliformis]|nr:ALIX V-shaped domain binding to HIV-domain-containing protein [Gautieria morchelliformis]
MTRGLKLERSYVPPIGDSGDVCKHDASHEANHDLTTGKNGPKGSACCAGTRVTSRRSSRARLCRTSVKAGARANLVGRVERLAASDDVAPRFMREAASVAMWVEVRPEIFERAIEEELEEALEGIKERNTLFLDSRREDLSVKAREHALQSLDLAYHEYRDICRHLTEGIKFYNDFAAILAQFKESCKVWVLERRKDVEDLRIFAS